MAGMCDAVLLIEAVEKSGTLITAKLAAEYNRDVYVVPGSIFSETSKGTNLFLRLGATPIRNSEDILEGLGIKPRSAESRLVEIKREDLSLAEQKIYSLLLNPKSRDDLIRESGLSISEANMALSLMELKNLITESMGEVQKL
jgi:DNA processing protein